MELQNFVFNVTCNENPNLANEILTVIRNLPCEIRKTIAMNIVVSGGSSMGIGFIPRLVKV